MDAWESLIHNWDRYRIDRLLGMGGMGRTYLAYDEKLRRPLALKFLHERRPDWVQRFIGEARAQSLVEHERICKVFEAGELEGRPYIAMQYIEGQTLSETAESLSMLEKAAVIMQVAEAIHEAHRAGLLHRDIKPDNIMIARSEDGEPEPYILDFGLARRLSEARQTTTGAILGTLAYMSPEQARGESSLDRRGDVYSLGATLYRLLTGKPPFRGDSDVAVLTRILSAQPERPRASHPDIPRDLETIVLKCLEKEPGKRYESARALAQDLGRFLDGEPIQGRTAGWGYRVLKWSRRRRGLLAALTPALLAALVSLAWLGQTYRQTAIQERWAQEFGHWFESIDTLARYSRLSPIHDASMERGKIKQGIDRMEERLLAAEGSDAGYGDFAIARGLLAHEDAESALRRLNLAEARGFQEPQLALARGQAMTRLWQDALVEAALAGCPEARRVYLVSAVERREAGLLHLAPIVDALPEAARLSRMLRQEEQAAGQRPAWDYEPLAIAGFHQLEAGLKLLREKRPDLAANRLAEARARWREALKTAPSDARMRRALASSCLLEASLASDEMAAALCEEGLNAAETASAILPKNPASHLLRAELNLAMHLRQTETDRGRVAKAEEAAVAALATERGHRARMILEQEMPQLPAYDHDALAIERKYNEQDLQQVLAELAQSRAEFVAFFQQLTDEDWLRAGIHPEQGHFTLLDALLQVGSHDVNHLEQITRILR